MSPKRITDLIDDSETLAAFCAQMSGSSYITVDTEFIRDRTYWPRLCLVQVANHDLARAVEGVGLECVPRHLQTRLRHLRRPGLAALTWRPSLIGCVP